MTKKKAGDRRKHQGSSTSTNTVQVKGIIVDDPASYYSKDAPAALVSSVVVKFGFEPDPDPLVLQTWKKLWCSKVGNVPTFVTSRAQYALDDIACSLQKKKKKKKQSEEEDSS